MQIKTKSGRVLELPSPEEDRQITAAALTDPDNPPLTDAELQRWSIREARDRITHNGMLDLISIMNDRNWVVESTFSHTAMSRFNSLYRFEGLAKISVELGEIEDPDTPLRWIEWANGKGYKTDHLDSFIPEQLKPQEKPIKRQIQQEDEILRVISEILELDPLRLPKSEQGRRGVKADVLEEINKQPDSKKLLNPHPKSAVFRKAWERLLEGGRIRYQE